MSKENTVSATLVMELNVDCPECEHQFDLFSTDQNAEGDLYKQVLDDDRWKIEPEERLETYAYCPRCSVCFDVKGVIW